MVIGHGDNRRNADPRLIHWDQQEANPFLFFGIGIGADQGEDPVGVMGMGCPDFRTIDDIFVALALCAGFERRQIRT